MFTLTCSSKKETIQASTKLELATCQCSRACPRERNWITQQLVLKPFQGLCLDPGKARRTDEGATFAAQRPTGAERMAIDKLRCLLLVHGLTILLQLIHMTTDRKSMVIKDIT